ncbi:hypothetical protein RS030_81426 [Cryptosporidium xiaoi]|uniref:Uncharacterized protein n=1 Tax=Cryptosporidium xiaoi TaxID=659607 RepID=A0AAV9XV02_9CRYT
MPRKKRKRINFLKLFMVDGNPSKFDKSEKSDVYLEPADKNDRDDEQNLGVCLEGGDVNFDNAESEGHFDSLPSGSYSLSSESGFDECISTGKLQRKYIWGVK